MITQSRDSACAIVPAAATTHKLIQLLAIYTRRVSMSNELILFSLACITRPPPCSSLEKNITLLRPPETLSYLILRLSRVTSSRVDLVSSEYGLILCVERSCSLLRNVRLKPLTVGREVIPADKGFVWKGMNGAFHQHHGYCYNSTTLNGFGTALEYAKSALSGGLSFIIVVLRLRL